MERVGMETASDGYDLLIIGGGSAATHAFTADVEGLSCCAA